MIGTITLNPCVDKTLTISNFTYGGMNRVMTKRVDPSGKGINVSIILSQLGIGVRTFGIEYQRGSDFFKKSLEDYNIQYESVVVPGILRENVKILDLENKMTTELNQKGDYIVPEKSDEFERFLNHQMGGVNILVISGSVPQGIDKGYYYRLIKQAKEKGVCCILDAEGELLVEGMKAKPYLIKPNLYEFEMIYGLKSHKIKEIVKICKEIIRSGIEVVCLSLGEKGALIADKEEIYFCKPNSIDVKSTQGAGDSMVAGICIALQEGVSLGKMLTYGVAVAQGSLIREGTLLCTREGFEHFKKIIKVEKITEDNIEQFEIE